MQRIRILLADDIEPILRRYAYILSKSPAFEVVGTAARGDSAVEMARSLHPDVILMDVEMETRDAGIRATQKILAFAPETKIIILTVYEDGELINRAFQAGAVDYLMKDMPFEAVEESINNAYIDRTMIRPRIMDGLREELARLDKVNQSLLMMMNTLLLLTPSEISLIGLLLEGKSRADICELRAVEMSTVKSQVHSILRKTGMSSMGEVTEAIRTLGLCSVFQAQ